jgi:protein N-terminal methyltransferase
LSRHFDIVDLVEPIPAFLQKAESCLDHSSESSQRGRLGELVQLGLQHFHPIPGRYHVIWAQWVMSHLTDNDLVLFIQRSLSALSTKNGLLILKENLSRSDDYVVDEQDSSVTRSEATLRKLFDRAGATIVAEMNQTGFPRNLFPVKM